MRPHFPGSRCHAVVQPITRFFRLAPREPVTLKGPMPCAGRTAEGLFSPAAAEEAARPRPPPFNKRCRKCHTATTIRGPRHAATTPDGCDAARRRHARRADVFTKTPYDDMPARRRSDADARPWRADVVPFSAARARASLLFFPSAAIIAWLSSVRHGKAKGRQRVAIFSSCHAADAVAAMVWRPHHIAVLYIMVGQQRDLQNQRTRSSV